jgi:hypothetical protein
MAKKIIPIDPFGVNKPTDEELAADIEAIGYGAQDLTPAVEAQPEVDALFQPAQSPAQETSNLAKQIQALNSRSDAPNTARQDAELAAANTNVERAHWGDSISNIANAFFGKGRNDSLSSFARQAQLNAQTRKDTADKGLQDYTVNYDPNSNRAKAMQAFLASKGYNVDGMNVSDATTGAQFEAGEKQRQTQADATAATAAYTRTQDEIKNQREAKRLELLESLTGAKVKKLGRAGGTGGGGSALSEKIKNDPDFATRLVEGDPAAVAESLRLSNAKGQQQVVAGLAKTAGGSNATQSNKEELAAVNQIPLKDVNVGKATNSNIERLKALAKEHPELASTAFTGGKATGFVAGGLSALGSDKAKIAEQMIQLKQKILADVIKATSGAAASDLEVTRLAEATFGSGIISGNAILSGLNTLQGNLNTTLAQPNKKAGKEQSSPGAKTYKLKKDYGSYKAGQDIPIPDANIEKARKAQLID